MNTETALPKHLWANSLLESWIAGASTVSTVACTNSMDYVILFAVSFPHDDARKSNSGLSMPLSFSLVLFLFIHSLSLNLSSSRAILAILPNQPPKITHLPNTL